MAPKHRSDGFLLIELLVIILMSIFLFKLTFDWQGLIIQSRHEALNRLTVATKVRNIIEKMQSGNKSFSLVDDEPEGVSIRISSKLIIINELDKQLPGIKQSPFQLIEIETSWQGRNNKSHLTKFVTGITNAEA